MHELALEKATIKTVNNHQYYVFPKPATHTGYDNRPTKYAEVKKLVTYKGKGSNGAALLHPDVVAAANLFMSDLLEYGAKINDWSMLSAVIQNGYRPDDASQGIRYLQIIKDTIRTAVDKNKKKLFDGLVFPANLEEEAKGEFGLPGDPRRAAFQKKIGESPGWTPALAQNLLFIVHGVYAPRGFNPHATGLVFDLDFSICTGDGKESMVGANAALNDHALKSAAGMWINSYSTYYSFDSYNTDKEIFHMEYRK